MQKIKRDPNSAHIFRLQARHRCKMRNILLFFPKVEYEYDMIKKIPMVLYQ
jgi:hypothetical protein